MAMRKIVYEGEYNPHYDIRNLKCGFLEGFDVLPIFNRPIKGNWGYYAVYAEKCAFREDIYEEENKMILCLLGEKEDIDNILSKKGIKKI